ncbi:hypothetical protein D3C80_2176760 [compost metagenome]
MDFAIIQQRYHGLRLFFTVYSHLRISLSLADNQLILAASFPIVNRHLRPVGRQTGVDGQSIAMAF